MILFVRRCPRKYHRTVILILFLFLFLSINYLSNTNDYTAPPSSQLIQPLDRSSLLHINGNETNLGKISTVYLINLPTRDDRRTESIALLQRLNFDAFIVPAYSIYSREILSRQDFHLFFTITELACWASHMRLWMTISNTTSCLNKTWSLIFEDDIDLETMTPQIIQSFPDSIWNEADLIYLGHCANPPGKLLYQSSKYSYRIHQALHPSCTHAYAIRSDTARKLVYLLSKPSKPIDNSLVKLVNNHQLVAYSIHPPLAMQKPVSQQNPSNVNRINRDSWIYHIQFSIYTFLQWLNGVELYDTLKNSTLKIANFTNAKHWRAKYEKGIWKY
ncbi:hypothetical protein I4U23_024656 [Adineta vaga]|nr:hypothetical protein I4U23_024656 [Adineta vaga]